MKLDAATCKMIREVFEKAGCDAEQTAKWVARTIHCGIRQARELVAAGLSA